MIRTACGVAAAVVLALFAETAARADDAGDARTYADCMAAARKTPEQGFETASEWRDHGGGFPAEHCVAIALIGLKQYAEAARRLEDLATAMVKESGAMRAEVLAQGAEAWSEGGLPQNAEADLTEAIRIDPTDLDLLVSRSVARAGRQNYRGAIEDLNKAVAGGMSRGDVFAYRAAAYRLLGSLPNALADAERAVQLSPDMPESWLERANVRRLSGDATGARQDWLKVVTIAPNSAAADAARTNLETLDVHPDAAGATPGQ
jgi:tetratricopeptide (TPR) repeat protein